jgi:HK97 family phage major capsid protein
MLSYSEMNARRIVELTSEAATLARARLDRRAAEPLPNVGRMIFALSRPDGRLHGDDRELCQDFARQNGITFDSQRPTVPLEAALNTRDLTAGAAGAGGFLAGTEQGEVLSFLRARSVVGAFGAEILTGLVGDLTLPVLSGGVTVTWLETEATAAAEQNMAFGQVALAAKTVAVNVDLSRSLAIQSAGEVVAKNELATAIASAMDTISLTGTGAAGQPQGALNHPSINSVSGTSLAWSGALDFMVAAGAQHLDVTGFAMPVAIYKLLANRARLTNGSIPIIHDGTVDGRPARFSEAVPAGTLIGGPWDQLTIGIWGGLELQVDPFSAFKTRVISVRGMLTMDVALKRGSAFTKATSVT